MKRPFLILTRVNNVMFVFYEVFGVLKYRMSYLQDCFDETANLNFNVRSLSKLESHTFFRWNDLLRPPDAEKQLFSQKVAC